MVVGSSFMWNVCLTVLQCIQFLNSSSLLFRECCSLLFRRTFVCILTGMSSPSLYGHNVFVVFSRLAGLMSEATVYNRNAWLLINFDDYSPMFCARAVYIGYTSILSLGRNTYSAFWWENIKVVRYRRRFFIASEHFLNILWSICCRLASKLVIIVKQQRI